MGNRTEAILREAAAVHEALLPLSSAIEEVARRIADTLAGGGALYVMGNGGSAADSQHLAGELVGRFLIEGRRPLPCCALSTDTSVLTSLANDYGIEEVFARQVAAFVREGDAVIGISTSGESANVLAAVEEARRRGALTIALTGRGGGALADRCDLAVVVPADETPRIQEAHGTIIHIWCELVEGALSQPET
ncbi:MAG: D-sedoheptulose-7-phosphate isomerase [Planctomycetota bacterium]|jgi:D-sedoheptulose 7-phosphate isomerase